MKIHLGEDMKPRSGKCPHCGNSTVPYHHPARSVIYQRCPRCRCRWRPDGKYIIAGRHCPLQKRLPLPV